MPDVLGDASVRPRRIQRYGWKPSLPDLRDHIADASELPVHGDVDPRRDLPPVFDQGQLGSCTANAVAAAVEYDAKLNGEDPGPLSRLWVYYYERKIEGSPADQDTGAYGRDGFKVCKTLGVPLESDWPYDVAQFSVEPPAELAEKARQHRISNYRSVPRNLDSMRAVLSNRQTIAFGFTVYDSFESEEVAKTGIVPMPSRDDRVLGGHEVLLVGYLKEQVNYGLVRNSWGDGWALGGYFLMPWAYLMDANLASDFRTIRRPAGA
jgi:C1A family cysteine protease